MIMGNDDGGDDDAVEESTVAQRRVVVAQDRNDGGVTKDRALKAVFERRVVPAVIKALLSGSSSSSTVTGTITSRKDRDIMVGTVRRKCVLNAKAADETSTSKLSTGFLESERYKKLL
jgi:hypothetical protein